MIQQRGVDGGRVRRPDVAMAGPRQQAALPRPGKLNVGRFELSRSSKNELERLEERYWKQFSNPVYHRHHTSVSCLHFSPVLHNGLSAARLNGGSSLALFDDDHHTQRRSSSLAHAGGHIPLSARALAAVCSTRVFLYDPTTRMQLNTLSMHKAPVFCTRYRSDGRLIATGARDGSVIVFETVKRTALRTYGKRAKKKTESSDSAVRFVDFLGGSKLVAAGEDGMVRAYDLAVEAMLWSLPAHDDVVRCGATVAVEAEHVFVTGSYDHTVKLWDARASRHGEGSCECVRTFDHGAPVEALAVVGGGSILVSAGGTRLRAWDLLAGSCLIDVKAHAKTVTALAADGSGKRLLSGSLDGRVKVFDVQGSLEEAYAFGADGPVMSLALSPDNACLAIGSLNGSLQLKKRDLKQANVEVATKRKRHLRGSSEYFKRGVNHVPGSSDMTARTAAQAAGGSSVPVPVSAGGANRGRRTRSGRQRVYEKHLRAFKYKEALDAVFAKNAPASVVLALLTELKYRGGLGAALTGRDDVSLSPLLSFCIRHVGNERMRSVLLPVIFLMLDMFGHYITHSSALTDGFLRLQASVRRELDELTEVEQVRGMIEAFATASR